MICVVFHLKDNENCFRAQTHFLCWVQHSDIWYSLRKYDLLQVSKQNRAKSFHLVAIHIYLPNKATFYGQISTCGGVSVRAQWSALLATRWFLNIFLHVLVNNLKKVEYWPTSFQAFNDYQNNNFSLPSSLHSFRAKKEVLMTKSDVMDMWYIHQTTLRTEFHPVSFVGDTYRSTKPQSTRRT